MGERFLKHPPKSQIERVFGGGQTDSILYARVPSSLCGSRKGPVLLTLSVLLTLLAYDFFLNFWIRLSALSICLMDLFNFRLGLIHHWRIPPKIANRPMMANR